MALQKISLFGMVFLLLAGTACAEDKDKWPVCQTASDCVVVGSGCAVTAVNKKYRSEADRYYQHAATLMECATSIDPATAAALCLPQRTSCKNGNPASTCISKDKACSAVPLPDRGGR